MTSVVVRRLLGQYIASREEHHQRDQQLLTRESPG